MIDPFLPSPGVLQAAPHARAQDRAPVQWTGAVVTTAYLPTKTLQDVVPSVRPQFEALIAYATSLGLKPKVRSAGRTCEQQQEQLAGGYSEADLCRSMHVIGHAVDLDVTPGDCATYTKLGEWWEKRGGVWGGRWKQFGPCGDSGHFHYGFNGAGAVPTSICPSSVTLAECQKIREAYLDKAFAAGGGGVSSNMGILAGLAILGAAGLILWGTLSVKPGIRSNPTWAVGDAVKVYAPGTPWNGKVGVIVEIYRRSVPKPHGSLRYTVRVEDRDIWLNDGNLKAVLGSNPSVSKAQVEKAVKAAQLYHGSEGLYVKTQQRFYDRMMKLVNAIADKHGADRQSVFDQITAEARRRGKISPLPGKDY